MSNDLAEFLLARIREGEAEWRRVAASPRGFGKTHALRHLAECEAKRRIIAAYQDAKHHYDEEHDVDGSPKYSDGAVWAYLDKLEVWEQVLKLTALPYADHEDFRSEWRV